MNWLIEHVPFWALFVGAVALVGVAWRLLGVRGAMIAGAFLAVLALYREGRKDGRASEQEKDRTDAADAIREADAARVDARLHDADPERLRRSDGFRRD